MLKLLNDISQFVATHESTMMVMAAWASREWHQLWPTLKNAFPYIRENGGVWGLFKEFWVGKENAIVSTVTQQTTV